MPDAPITPGKRRIEIDPDLIDAPPRAPFVELGLVSNFSFLRGASDAPELVKTARELGYDAIGIADANTMAGVVRIRTNAKAAKLRPVIGCRIETIEGLSFLAYPKDRAAYGRLCRLISTGRRYTLDDEWQDKGVCEISLGMLADHADGVQLILLPPDDLEKQFTIAVPNNVIPFPTPDSRGDAEMRRDVRSSPSVIPAKAGIQLPSDEEASRPLRASAPLREITAAFADLLPHLVDRLPTLRHLAASYLYTGDDIARIDRLDALVRANELTLLATNDVHYHVPDRRPLQDVMTAIRHKTTVAEAGHLLFGNAERHLKSPDEMVKLFARWPHAIAAAREVADACAFSLDHLRYEYPEEIYPDGMTPQQYLEKSTWEGAEDYYPRGVPDNVRKILEHELALIDELDLARYFLTIKDIVDYTR